MLLRECACERAPARLVRCVAAGRIVPAEAPSGTCPTGTRVFLVSAGQLYTEDAGFAQWLDSEQLAEVESGLYDLAGYGDAAAYMLGCPQPGHADYVFVKTDASAGPAGVVLFVDNRLVANDPRFRPGAARPSPAPSAPQP
jgi:hypothetical protein